MSVTDLLGLRPIATVAVLSLSLGVAACNEEGGDDGGEVGAAPSDPVEPAPMDEATPPAQ